VEPQDVAFLALAALPTGTALIALGIGVLQERR
jgi:hypothetical protein